MGQQQGYPPPGSAQGGHESGAMYNVGQAAPYLPQGFGYYGHQGQPMYGQAVHHAGYQHALGYAQSYAAQLPVQPLLPHPEAYAWHSGAEQPQPAILPPDAVPLSEAPYPPLPPPSPPQNTGTEQAVSGPAEAEKPAPPPPGNPSGPSAAPSDSLAAPNSTAAAVENPTTATDGEAPKAGQQSAPVSFAIHKPNGGKIPKNPSLFRSTAKNSATKASNTGKHSSRAPQPGGPSATPPDASKQINQEDRPDAPMSARKSRWGPDSVSIPASLAKPEPKGQNIASPTGTMSPRANPSSPSPLEDGPGDFKALQQEESGLAKKEGLDKQTDRKEKGIASKEQKGHRQRDRAGSGRSESPSHSRSHSRSYSRSQSTSHSRSRSPSWRRARSRSEGRRRHRSNRSYSHSRSRSRSRSSSQSPSPSRGSSRHRSRRGGRRHSRGHRRTRSRSRSPSGSSSRSRSRSSDESSPRKRAWGPPPAPRREADAGRNEPSPGRDFYHRRGNLDRARQFDYRRGDMRGERRPFYSRRSPSYSPQRFRGPRRDDYRDRNYSKWQEQRRQDSRSRGSRSPYARDYRHRPPSPIDRSRDFGRRRGGNLLRREAPRVTHSPEEGEVVKEGPGAKGEDDMAVDMEIEEESPRARRDEAHQAGHGPPPLPSEAPPPEGTSRSQQLAEAANFCAQTEARLDAIFAKHNLDRKSATTYEARGELAAKLNDGFTCAKSDRLILTFDNDMAEERSTSDADDLSFLGHPDIWGFPRWLPTPAPDLPDMPPSPQALIWETREEGNLLCIPMEAAEGLVDPRPYAVVVEEKGGASPSRKQALLLPAFARRDLHEAKAKKSCSSHSWSNAPLADVLDGADSRVRVPAAPPGHPPHQAQAYLQPGIPSGPSSQPKMNPLPMPHLHLAAPPGNLPQQPVHPVAPLVQQPVIAPTPQPVPCQQPVRQRVEPEESNDWTWLGRRGKLCNKATTLDRLRYLQESGREGMVKGACAYRASDNLWLPVERKRKISLKDLEWPGAEEARKRVRQSVDSTTPDQEVRLWFDKQPGIHHMVEPKPLSTNTACLEVSQGPSNGNAASSASDADVVSWAEDAYSSCTAHLAHMLSLMKHNQRQIKAPDKPGIWGPPPPPNISAIIKARLAMSLMGSKDSETLAAGVIETAFEEVMRKEPERQAKLKAQRDQAERERKQAELRRQAQEHKREEERRKEKKRQAAIEEQLRAEKRSRLLKEREEEREREKRREEERREREDRRALERQRREDERKAKERQEAKNRQVREQGEEEEQQRKGDETRRNGLASAAQQSAAGLSIPASSSHQEISHVSERLCRVAEGENPSDLQVCDPAAAEQRSAVRNQGNVPKDEDEDYLPHPHQIHGGRRGRGRPSRQQKAASNDDDDDDDEYVPSSRDRGTGRKRKARAGELEGATDGKLETPRKRGRPPRPKAAESSASEGYNGMEQAVDPDSDVEVSSEDSGDDKLAQAKRQEVRAALLKRLVPEAIKEMWNALRKFDRDKLTGIFADPVDRKSFPTYDEVVEAPMDLKTLGKKLRQYPDTMEGLYAFREDVLRISGNAVTFSRYLVDEDLHVTAMQFADMFANVYQQKLNEIESAAYL